MHDNSTEHPKTIKSHTAHDGGKLKCVFGKTFVIIPFLNYRFLGTTSSHQHTYLRYQEMVGAKQTFFCPSFLFLRESRKASRER